MLACLAWRFKQFLSNWSAGATELTKHKAVVFKKFERAKKEAKLRGTSLSHAPRVFGARYRQLHRFLSALKLLKNRQLRRLG